MSTSDDTQAAMTYPTTDQYSRWKDRAAKLNMSVSEFMQAMVEAGIKVDRGFELQQERDETRQQLREQRNDLKDELEHARNRIEKLENQLYRGERAAIVECIRENSGSSYGEIGQYLTDTIPDRLPEKLDDMEGDLIQKDGDYYYLSDKGDDRL